jgi:hypothetical protein
MSGEPVSLGLVDALRALASIVSAFGLVFDITFLILLILSPELLKHPGVRANILAPLTIVAFGALFVRASQAGATWWWFVFGFVGGVWLLGWLIAVLWQERGVSPVGQRFRNAWNDDRPVSRNTLADVTLDRIGMKNVLVGFGVVLLVVISGVTRLSRSSWNLRWRSPA